MTAAPPQRTARNQMGMSPFMIRVSARGRLQRLSGGVEREFQRLARHAVDERPRRPAEAEGNTPGERHRLALDVDPAAALDEPPVGVEPPQVAAVLADRLLALGRLPRALDLGDAGTADAA